MPSNHASPGRAILTYSVTFDTARTGWNTSETSCQPVFTGDGLSAGSVHFFVPSSYATHTVMPTLELLSGVSAGNPDTFTRYEYENARGVLCRSSNVRQRRFWL